MHDLIQAIIMQEGHAIEISDPAQAPMSCALYACHSSMAPINVTQGVPHNNSYQKKRLFIVTVHFAVYNLAFL